MPDEVNTLPRVHLLDTSLENLCTFHRAACGRNTRDEYFGPIRLENLLDSAPVRNFERRDGRSDSNGVKSEQAVAENNRMLRGEICRREDLSDVEPGSARSTYIFVESLSARLR